MSKRLIKIFTARSTFGGRCRGHGSRAMVPAPVRDRLGAKPGDTLVFEEGCERSVMLASLRGTYFVVRVERAEEAKIDVESAVTVESGVVEDDSLPESFIESVKRKLEGK